MFKEEDEENGCVVLLGIPVRKRSRKQKEAEKERRDGEGVTSVGAIGTSYVGGKPAWLSRCENEEIYSELKKKLSCKVCGKDLVFVCQIYAPTDVLVRYLYVFGCNSSGCANAPGTWRVLRTQERAAVQGSKTTENDKGSSSVVSKDIGSPTDAGESAEISQAMTSWDIGLNDSADNADDVWNTMGGGGGGEWDVSIDEGSWDCVAKVGNMTTTTGETPLVKRSGGSTTSAAAPKVEKSVQAETTTKIDDKATSAVFVGSGETTAKLLPPAAFDLPATFPLTILDVLEEPYESESRATTTLHPAAIEFMSIENREAAVDEARSTGEAYEPVDPDKKYFLRFQKRLKRLPGQCLRYAYGGEPLWHAKPPTPPLSVPPCPGCGARRLFEAQLTPQVLHLLDIDDNASGLDNAKILGTSVDAKNRKKIEEGGMDWGGVYVFSCPNSCVASYEEHAYVTQGD